MSPNLELFSSKLLKNPLSIPFSRDAQNQEHSHRSNQFTSNMTLECNGKKKRVIKRNFLILNSLVTIHVPPEFLEDSRYQITMQFLKFEVDAYNTTACKSYLEIEDNFYCGSITGDSGVFSDAVSQKRKLSR